MPTIIHPALQQAIDEAAGRCLVRDGVCQHCGLHLPECDWCDSSVQSEAEMTSIISPALAEVIEACEPHYKLNSDRSVAVATDTYCSTDMSACPRGCKVYLIGRGGVGHLAVYDGDPFWIEWAPLPKRTRK